MKFGKQLAKVVALSDPEWAPFWVSYKALKKRVKELTDSPPPGTQPRDAGTVLHGHHAAPATNTEPNPKELAQSAGEVAFFRTLRAEVAKASEFYMGMEQQMGARRRRIKMGLQYLKQPTTVLEDDAWIKMRRACISLYKDLLLLENFAVMNYCACSKALKKHDKTVVLDTRARFMRNVVNQQPFTHYPRLLEMLQEMEETFKEIDASQGDTARPLEDEERLFLEAIRGLNQEASSMQREEKADLGHASSTSDQEHSADDQPAASDAASTARNAATAVDAVTANDATGTASQSLSQAKRPAAQKPTATIVPEWRGGAGDGGGGEAGARGGSGDHAVGGDMSEQVSPAEEVDAEPTGGESAGKRRRV